MNASELDLEGFWGGTTKKERRGMAAFHEELSVGLERLLGLPTEDEQPKSTPGTKRRAPQKLPTFSNTYDYLATVKEPSEADLGLA